jgi:hypothetical protein
MSMRIPDSSRCAIVCALLLGLGTARMAHAAQGRWSVGGTFGAGIYAGGSLNDSLAASGLREVKAGWEYGGSIRYRARSRLSIDCEVVALNGRGTTDALDPKFVAETHGIAIPISLYYQARQNDAYTFSLFAGAGPAFGMKWTVEQGAAESKSRGKSAIYAHAGFEGQLRAGERFGFTSRALARFAMARDVEQADDPLTRFDVSMNGAAFSVGIRWYFGSSGE